MKLNLSKIKSKSRNINEDLNKLIQLASNGTDGDTMLELVECVKFSLGEIEKEIKKED